MFQDIMHELKFFPLLFNFHLCGFDIYGTLIARINRVYRGVTCSSFLIMLPYMPWLWDSIKSFTLEVLYFVIAKSVCNPMM
jgi:hypothetical protein